MKTTSVIYGINKVGKSHFASLWPNPLFVATERGLDFIEYRLEIKPIYCMEWTKLREKISEIREKVSKVSLEDRPKTLVLDTIDSASLWLKSDFRKRNKGLFPSEFEWGVGWDHYNSEWREFIAEFLSIDIENIIFVSHLKENADRKTRKNNLPDVFPGSFIYRSSIDFVLAPVNFILYLSSGKDGKRAVHTIGTKEYMAGNRGGLFPPKIEVDENFSDFFTELKKVDEKMELLKKGEKI